MPENEFEKQVQEKMDQFNLVPSPAVWNMVEARTRKEKKKRFIFFWLFAVLFAGGIATTWLLITGNSKTDQQAIQTTQPVENNNTIIPEEKKSTLLPDSQKLNNPGEIISQDQKISSENKLTGIPLLNPDENNRESIRLNNSKKNYPIIPPEKPAIIQQNDPAPTKNDKTVIQNKPVETNPAIQNNKEPEVTKEKETKQPDQPVLVTQNSDINQPDNKKTDSATSIITSPKAITKKIRDLNLAISVGESALVDNFSIFSGRLYMDQLAQQFPPGPAVGAPTQAFINPSISFSAGLFLRKPLSPKLNLNTGVSYHFFSTRMHAGTRIDSTRTINNSYTQNLTVNQYYRPSHLADEADYANKYHFLALSAELSWKFIGNKKFSVSWNNGISFNRLIGSNMLHYDRGLQVYYKDNNRMKQNQVFFNTSLEIPLFKRISISPFASFGITNALKKDSARRYSNYGLQLRFSLNKK